MCNDQVRLVFVVLLLLASFEAGLCIKCYECPGNDYKACGDAFDAQNASIIACQSSYVCVKYKSSELFYYSALTNRDCVYEGFCDNLRSSTDYCSECNEDLCNSSSVGTPFGTVAVLLFAKHFL